HLAPHSFPTRRSSDLDTPRAARHPPRRAACDVDDPDPGAAVLLVDNLPVISIFFASLDSVGLRLRHEESDLAAVRRPAKCAHVLDRKSTRLNSSHLGI